MKNKFGLYLHYPFCKRLCFYCHFIKKPYKENLSKTYMDYLRREILLKGDREKIINSIYFGGGSPALSDNSDIRSVFETIEKNYTVKKNAETTIEINPEDAEIKKILDLRKAGFNRISVGVQSFSDDDLKYLRRNHNSDMSYRALINVREAGFENINADFIIGLPNQTSDSLKRGFEKINELKIPHLSVYILEGVKKNENNARDEYLYFTAEKILNEMGYLRYEVSNYSLSGKKNFQSVHNKKYWENKEYIAVGLSASGFEKDIDYKNTEDMNEYFEKIDNLRLPIVEENKIDYADRMIITGLRTEKGVLVKYFEKYKKITEQLLNENILFEHDNRISVSPDKILLLNEILTYFR